MPLVWVKLFPVGCAQIPEGYPKKRKNAVFTGRIAAKRHTAGIKFTHRPKIRFLAPQGRLVAPIHAKLAMADGHLGPLGCAKFHLNRRTGVEMRPQNIKNFHFLVKSHLAGMNP